MNKLKWIVFVLTLVATHARAQTADKAAEKAAEKPQIGIPDEQAPSGFIWAGAILAMCGLGAYAVLAAKKKQQSDDLLKVLARQSLGGRARLLLVAVRGRELLLSVNEKGANLLVDWPADQDHEDLRLDVPAGIADDERPARNSDAVSGLLRLREKTEPKIPISQLTKTPPAPAPAKQAPPAAPAKRATTAAPAAWNEIFAQEMTQMRKVSR